MGTRFRAEKDGVNFFLIDEGADTGPILSQKIVEIYDYEDASALYEKMTIVAEKQLVELLPKLDDLKSFGRAQNNKSANSWRKRDARDGRIDWRMNATNIFNLVRSLSHPYVGAHFTYNNLDYKVWKCKVVHLGAKNIEPGKVLRNSVDSLVIKCGLNSIEISEIEPMIDVEEGEYL